MASGSGRASRTAMDIFKSDRDFISTYSKKIDEMLNGGIRTGVMTEICGNPGSGKSNLCAQLCVAVQTKFGVSSEKPGAAIYIDTEGSFVPIRLQNMAIAGENHYRNVDGLCPSAEEILKNVTFFRCINIAELVACLFQLRTFMQNEGNVRLIILDSLAHPIRSLVDGDHLTRHKQTIRIVNILQKLAAEFDCAVVVVNHMVAKIDSNKNEAYCAPALGDTFGHMSQLRIQLSWKMNQREARVLKSPHLAEGSTFFRITDDGIRDVDPNETVDQENFSFGSQQRMNTGM